MKELKIILFGQLAEVSGSNTIAIENVSDTNALAVAVNKLYPAMANIKYVIAVDKKIVRENTLISATSNVALLPPFSGG